MVVHHLEMETDEEELESLTAEVNNGRKLTPNNSNNKLANKKTRVLLGLGCGVAWPCGLLFGVASNCFVIYLMI